MKSNILNVILIDSDVAFHEGCSYYFEKYKDYRLTGIFTTVNEALKNHSKLRPDIIILEASLPNLNGLEGIPLLRKKFRDVKIVMISDQADFELIKKSFKNGANGFITKPVGKKRLHHALNSIKYEGAMMSKEIVKQVISNFHQKSYIFFSARENEIVDYLCKGATYKDIADKLFVTPSAINFHIQNIYLKLNVNCKSQALLKLQEMD